MDLILNLTQTPGVITLTAVEIDPIERDLELDKTTPEWTGFGTFRTLDQYQQRQGHSNIK